MLNKVTVVKTKTIEKAENFIKVGIKVVCCCRSGSLIKISTSKKYRNKKKKKKKNRKNRKNPSK